MLVKVARLFEFKGHDDVLDAIKLLFEDQSLAPELQHARDKVHVLFVGGGIWRDRIANSREQLGLADRIHFAGLCVTRIPNFCTLVISSSTPAIAKDWHASCHKVYYRASRSFLMMSMVHGSRDHRQDRRPRSVPRYRRFSNDAVLTLLADPIGEPNLVPPAVPFVVSGLITWP